MAVVIDGKTKRLGLALSGGGFRAAAFHLGVLRKLEQLDLLWKVDLLTCVSGGSIVGAFLAANWQRDDALSRLDTYLRTRSIAVSSVIAGLLSPFESRLDKLAGAYDADLFEGLTLDALRNGPRTYINATNLATGNLFFFVAGDDKETVMGDHELGVQDARDFSLANAVAASSAFPPVFPPLKLDQSVYPTADVDYVTLTDGGVYDNLGVNPIFRERNDLDFAIASDGGRPFAINSEATESSAIVLKAALDILMEQVRGLQFQRMELSAAAHRGPTPLWLSIDSEKGEQQSGDAAFASSIGTNLKRLNDAEMAVLLRHGSALAQSRLSQYAPELLSAG